MIQARNLKKTYRKKTAVDDLSFTVATGKVTGFLGPNGAGKSTTMRLMLGLDGGEGQTTYDGKRLTDYEHPAEIVGILLEAKAFHPTRTARNHLKVLAAASGVTDERVDEVLDIVGLSDVAKNPGKFSLGMSQRLGIAAAILAKPKYLLLDEPANGLDPEGIAWLRVFIREYAHAGNSVLISSHLLSEMSQMADNVVVIGRGKLIADTSMKKLIAKGSHPSVFVRASNTTKLLKALKAAGYESTSQNDGLLIDGVKTDDIAKVAHDAGVTVLELASHQSSLEDVFLEITANTEEYVGHSQKGKK